MAPSRHSVERFQRDLQEIAGRMGLREELEPLVGKLVEMYRRGLVKINHTAMELVVAGHLIRRGYERVDVEHRLPDGLVCDVYAERLGDGLVVEVETGFTPPSNALDPLDYLRARLAAKIARYSRYAGKMALAVPPYYAAPVPSILLHPPKARRRSELERLKSLVDHYYRDPPVSLEDLQLARLHAVILVDVDRGEAVELDPEKYYETLGDIARRYSDHGLLTRHSLYSIKQNV